jgi:hypothetical protein
MSAPLNGARWARSGTGLSDTYLGVDRCRHLFVGPNVSQYLPPCPKSSFGGIFGAPGGDALNVVFSYFS